MADTKAAPDLLRAKMARKKMTMADLAERVDSSGAAVSRWLSGQRTPEARARIALRREMGIPIEAWDQQ